jgi:hypothetical protein
MVMVKRDGERPTVQNQAEVSQARAAAMAEAAATHHQAMPGMAQAMQPGATPRGPLPMVIPSTRKTRNMTKNRKNSIFAMPAAVAAIPVNPSNPAINAMIKNNATIAAITSSMVISIFIIFFCI